MPVQVFTTLDAPSATLSGTSADGINASGAIVGHYQQSATVSNGFLYSGGTYTILANPSTLLWPPPSTASPLQTASTTPAKSSAGTPTRTTLFTPSSTAAAPSPPSTFRVPSRAPRLPMASTTWARS